jgi:hypothetical protein
MNFDKQQITPILQRISNMLLINGGFLNNSGLYTGEMGFVLYFFRYARYSQNELYSKYGFDLIEKIQNRIYQETPINYKQGLAGIGSAIEYLVQNGFIETHTDEVLEDFDKRIFFTFNLPYLPVDDILSIGYYAHWRMSGNSTKKEFLQRNILPPIEHLVRSRAITPAWHPLSRKEQVDHSISNSFHISLKNNSINDVFEEYSHNLGIHNGLAGLGMTLLTELDGDSSWIDRTPSHLLK